MTGNQPIRLGLATLCLTLLLIACGDSEEEPIATSTEPVATATADTELELATQLVDEWVAGWRMSDPDAVVAVFTGDAVADGLQGHEAIRADVEEQGSWATDERRTGDLVQTEPGIYVFPAAYDWTGHGEVTGEIEIELQDDLIARLEWLWKEVDYGAN